MLRELLEKKKKKLGGIAKVMSLNSTYLPVICNICGETQHIPVYPEDLRIYQNNPNASISRTFPYFGSMIIKAVQEQICIDCLSRKQR